MQEKKFDTKTIITLIAFIVVGVILFATIFSRNSQLAQQSVDPDAPKAIDNVVVSEGAYYGSEAVSAAGKALFDKEGNPIDIATITKEAEFYDENGKMINLPTISKKEYDAITENMSYQKVCEIIGGEGEIVREVDKPGDEFYTVCYFFYGDKAQSSASFIFQSDELVSKANTNIADDK